MEEFPADPVVVVLSAAELAGLERAIAPRVPGGELELGDAVIATFDIDCLHTGAGYELTCEPEGFVELLTFVTEADVRLQGGLDDDLDAAIDAVLAAADD